MVKYYQYIVLITQIVSLFNFSFRTGITSEQLENGLHGEIKQLADTFVDIEDKYGINSVLYASMVALESGWGNSEISKTKNNITSYTCKSGFKIYETKEECLYDMAEHLSNNYLSENGKYYCGSQSIDDVACYYLIGKAKEDLNEEERKAVSEYSRSVKEIYNDILDKSLTRNKSYDKMQLGGDDMNETEALERTKELEKNSKESILAFKGSRSYDVLLKDLEEYYGIVKSVLKKQIEEKQCGGEQNG